MKQLILQLTTRLTEKHMTITSAESCTGGLIASLLTELPGSSTWFDRGFITYTAASKETCLGVSSTLIEAKGEVSLEVAEQMVIGALEHSLSDCALSVTGIAGPSGGSKEKPVGTVCFAWGVRQGVISSQCVHFKAVSRAEIRAASARFALEGMYRHII